jgi:hypothetical protein
VLESGNLHVCTFGSSLTVLLGLQLLNIVAAT